MPLPPYPSVPNPVTWVPGPVPVPALRNDVTNGVTFLASRPLFIGQQNAGQSIPNSADTGILWPVELVDTWRGHDPLGAHPERYYCQAPGWYLARVSAPFAYTGGTQYLFAAGFSALTAGVSSGTIRGGMQLNGSTHNPGPSAVDLIKQTVTGAIGGSGDYIQATAVQTTGGAISLQNTATQLPYVSIRWVASASGTAGLPVPSNPSWPVPPAYITAAGYLNPAIRDTVRFLTYPPVVKATLNSGSMPSTAFPSGAVVPLSTVVVDNYSGFTTGASASYTAPVAGVYYVYGQFNLQPSAASTGYCAGLSVNGGTTQWGDSVYKISDSTGGGATAGKRLRLAAGDTIQLIGCQGSGAAINYQTAAINQTRFIAVWESS